MTRPNDATPALPQNLDAERSVLGAILLDESKLETTAHLAALDFFHDHHRRIYRAMLAMHAQQRAIDLVTLMEFLTSERSLEAAGGVGYLSSLMDGVPKISNVGQYVAIIKEKARLRAIIHHAEAMQRAAFDPSANADTIEQLLQTNVTGLQATAAHANGNGHLGSSLVDFMGMDFPPPEHLVEGLIPRGGSILIVALPHRMKSWFTISMALACTRAGTALGKLEVARPVRTMLVQVEDHESIVKQRIGGLITTTQFMGCAPDNVWVVKRSDFNGFTPEWCARLKRQAIEWKADLIILDVLRRIFQGHGDLNSPSDSASFLERIDEIRDSSGAAIALVHHENKKDADLMNASAGSYNFPGWANVVIQFKRKTMEGSGANQVTHVEIEVDNKLGVSSEPLRMVLDLSSPTPVRLEALEDGDGLRSALDEMDTEWNVRTLCEVMGIHRTSAARRIKKWMQQGKIEKVRGGKKGRAGGLATYRAIESGRED